MNRSELIKHIASQAGLNQTQATNALDAVIAGITDTLASGGDVTLVGFGTFKVTDRAARTGRNPKTGEEIQIAASKVPTFKAGKGLKEAVN
ncbi:HU family DNA-binding protein [Acinetobacter haemolyticus]|uniref:HU family DNA-binding protein n=1 Tax=Acinetobacter haemolyticus TaxID=29430 RepID=UPI0034D3A9AD